MEKRKRIPRVMIAAVSSGSGKTTITCSLLQSLLNHGMKPVSHKCGPDYIDPMFHRHVLGMPGGNLDSFFCEEKWIRYLLARQSELGTISVIEGVMGYFDGIGMTYKASSFDIARITNTPVILIVNTKGMSGSIPAVIQGFLEYERRLLKEIHQEDKEFAGGEGFIQGVILNQLPASFYPAVKAEVEKLGVICFGYVPSKKEWKLESRHLGLWAEQKNIREKISGMADFIEQTVDVQGIIKLAQSGHDLEICQEPISEPVRKRVKLAVARDEAFSFIYPENIMLLEELGCEIQYFSPIRDSHLPEHCQGLILNGGYPELYARQLSENKSIMREIKEALESGIPALAECGGFMYLHEELENKEKEVFSMVGMIKGRVFYTGKLSRFGYIYLENEQEGKLKAHEFHYWDSENNGNRFHAVKASGRGRWEAGHKIKNLYAGFPHLYYYGNIDFVKRFVEEAIKYEGKK